MGELREPLQQLAKCGLPTALEAMGERWSFMILRATFNGVRHFEEFISEISIARNILANRLTRLTESGILRRTPCPDDRRKVEYRLTDKGLDLLPTMIALRQWGENGVLAFCPIPFWSTTVTASQYCQLPSAAMMKGCLVIWICPG